MPNSILIVGNVFKAKDHNKNWAKVIISDLSKNHEIKYRMFPVHPKSRPSHITSIDRFLRDFEFDYSHYFKLDLEEFLND